MTTVVTGATGFLGSALVTELVKRQQPLRLLARDEKHAHQLFGDAGAIIPGAITDAAQVQRAVDGASTRYHLAGERPVSVRELATAIAHAQGKHLPAGSIPLWLANGASDVFAVMPGMRGERAPLTRSRVRLLTQSRIYEWSRATCELGYVPNVSLEEGMKLTAAWYDKHQYVSGSSTRRRRTV
jgi:nucleoside-diphosphate-sugar epimerase